MRRRNIVVVVVVAPPSVADMSLLDTHYFILIIRGIVCTKLLHI
jgi:hypothetical protein